MTREELVRHGAAIERLMNDKAVQDVFAALEQVYYKQWTTAASPGDREILWQKAGVLGDLKRSLEESVAVGQSEAHALQLEEEREALQQRARNQH